MAAYWADLAGTLPDRLDRGRHGRGGLGRLEGADRRDRRHGPARRRRPLRDERRAPARAASSSGVGNSILIKVNQIGTLTETLEAIAHGARGRLHRGHVAPLRRDRGRHDRRPRRRDRLRPDQDRRAVALATASAKYNQLLRIEEALGADAEFPGPRGLPSQLQASGRTLRAERRVEQPADRAMASAGTASAACALLRRARRAWRTLYVGPTISFFETLQRGQRRARPRCAELEAENAAAARRATGAAGPASRSSARRAAWAWSSPASAPTSSRACPKD